MVITASKLEEHGVDWLRPLLKLHPTPTSPSTHSLPSGEVPANNHRKSPAWTSPTQSLLPREANLKKEYILLLEKMDG